MWEQSFTTKSTKGTKEDRGGVRMGAERISSERNR
jgi:hypothetical protein